MQETPLHTNYHRICPACGSHQPPEVMRCSCGTLLAGIDLVRDDVSTAHAPAVPATQPAPADLLCSHEDCGQSNPPGSTVCAYCNRPLRATVRPDDHTTLLQLPTALAERYRLLDALPTQGSEAELLRVERLTDSQPAIVKLYRAGIQPKSEVQARLAHIDPRCCVRIFETGSSGAHAWEVMEYCAHGSLRARLQGTLAAATLRAVIAELAQALAAIHAQGVVHRDLKPENILIRSLQPLDLVLTDFGIASVLDATQCFTGMARTLMYAPPESLSGVIDAKADYWALGMIVLEAVRGTHPFARLSDAVILHHLSTRTIDVDDILDADLRKLIRGLLLRDPRQRWGERELARWLARDTTLAEPFDARPGAEGARPYHLGKDVCHTPEQLAIALARNWQTGISDLLNGQLQTWFREQQHDQNTVRLLIEGQHELKLSPHRQLLRLILHLAPGIPPVWRGESVEPRSILHRASLALKGEEASALWLMDVYQERVLDAYSAAGNPDLSDLRQRWISACDAFATRWRERMAEFRTMLSEQGVSEARYVDDALYAREPLQPALGTLLPRMLALIYDRGWGARLRQYIATETLSLAAQSPWLTRLGDPLQMDDTDLLVLEGMLPDARKANERFLQRERQNREQTAIELAQLERECGEILARLHSHENHTLFTAGVGEALNADIEALLDIIERLRAKGEADATWQNLRRRMGRIVPFIKRLQDLVYRHAERRAINDAITSPQNFGILGILLIVATPVFGLRAWLAGSFLALLLVLWRLVPQWRDMQRARELLGQI